MEKPKFPCEREDNCDPKDLSFEDKNYVEP